MTTRRPWPLCVFCGVKLHRVAIRVYVKSADAWRCYDRVACAARLGEQAFLGSAENDGPETAAVRKLLGR